VCGIIGIVSDKGNLKERIIEGLKRLEYRGYDSAGVALRKENGIFVRKKKGKVSQLEEELREVEVNSRVGIGHTRWATHGEPSDPNSHPHSDCTGRIALVHNGIIENYPQLKEELRRRGHNFRSQTDSEVIAHLVEEEASRDDFLEAVRRAVNRLEGSFALVIINSDEDALYIARKDSPLVVGLGEGESFVASDIPAFLPWTNRVIFLENGEIGRLSFSGVEIYDFQGKRKEKKPQVIGWSLAQAEKGGYRHFMLKEIHEQAKAISDTIGPRIERDTNSAVIEDLPLAPRHIKDVLILACGTSYHAGLVGKFYFEELAGLKTDVDYASEFRYRRPVLSPSTLVVAISQSGETADTIGALRKAKEMGAPSLAICNVVGSSITREADSVLYTHAGPEISVASTKAFTTQLSLLYLLAVYLGRERGKIDREQESGLLSQLLSLPSKIEHMLREQEEKIREIGVDLSSYNDALYLGRHLNYPIALEGALKLKEISYIHAEGYPAGEMKHGPIALIDENLPTVFIATESKVLDKVRSNMEEIKSRRGKIISLLSGEHPEIEELSDGVIKVPLVDEYLFPIINIIPLQLIAYYAADFLGHDVDQPRNLAKSVTVE